jgi:hypothetical protein
MQKYATIYDQAEGRAGSKDNTTPEWAPGVRKATMKSGIYRQVYKRLRNLRTYSVFQIICKAPKQNECFKSHASKKVHPITGHEGSEVE